MVSPICPRFAYDCPLSGMERPTLLRHLASRQPDAAWVAEADGRPTGFVLGREGRSASSIGPVVADDEDTGLALIAKATASVPGPFIIDVPDAHAEIRRWLEGQGAVSPRGYMRMTLGEAPGSTIRAISLLSPDPNWDRMRPCIGTNCLSRSCRPCATAR